MNDREKTVKMMLECLLTDKEKLGYSKELGEAISKRNRALDSLKSFQTQAKADLAGVEANIAILADKLNTGHEYRDVECDIVYDWTAKEKRWIRSDTDVTVKTDIIPEKELQERLAL